MSDYLKKEWKKFRESVIESDGGKCVQCGRGEDEAVLQVHHKRYIKGRLPWQYGTKDCETLCKGCHAELHGHIKPRSGWDYLWDDDLGDLSGTCQNCGTSIRYVFHIGHEKWGFMEVGTHC
ncbi:MAG: HNH endonuclease [Chlorobiota bacterium]